MVFNRSKLYTALVVAAMILPAYFMLSDWKEKLRRTDPLIPMLDKLPMPQGATRLGDCDYGVKSASKRIYSCYYRTRLDFAQLLKFYTAQLDANGWREGDVTMIRDWGSDLGGQIVSFRKDDFLITLQYAGEKSDASWQYGLDAATSIADHR